MTTTFTTMASIRFGYGRRPGEAAPESVDALLRQVERGTRETCLFPHEGMEGRRARFSAYRELNVAYKAARDKGVLITVGKRAINPYNIALINSMQRDRHLKVRQAAFSPNGFYERLVAFWCDHFTVDVRKGGIMRLLAPMHEAEAIRPHLAGSFSDLLKAAVLHPAMLDYLDQTASIGPNSPKGLESGRGLNENLARELIELHTMGAGSGYSQEDVRSAAYVLTGLWWYRAPVYETVFRRRSAEPGVYRVLGKDYGGKRREIEQVYALLDDLAARKETRRHICRKLVVHFLADDPPQPVVEAMVAAWKRSDGRLLDVYRAMLEHPRSWEEEGRKARQPFDFVVAALRALDVPAKALEPVYGAKKADRPAADIAVLEDVTMMTADGRPALRANWLSAGTVERFGQPIWSAPSPAGWEEGLSAWITASQLTERIAWARRLVARFGGEIDPRAFLEATMGDAARADTIETVSRAPNRAVGLAMVLASPEFNRR